MSFDLTNVKLPSSLPKYQSALEPVEVLEHWCQFPKDEPDLFTIPEVGEVSLADVAFSLIHAENCFSAYVDGSYSVCDEENPKSSLSAMCIMLLEHKAQFFIKTLLARTAMTRIADSLHKFNTNFDLLDKCKGTALEGFPYLVVFAGISVTYKKSKASGEFYPKPSIRLLDLNKNRTERAANFIASQQAQIDLEACQKAVKEFLTPRA